MKIALILLALALPAKAADLPSTKLIKDIEGEYAHSIGAGKAGQTFKSDSRVELLRHGDSTMYVHLALTTPDGQRCTISGVASYERGAFVYRDPSPPLSGDQCTLTVAQVGDTLRLSDQVGVKGPGTCSAFCTTRTGLGVYAIPMANREKVASPARIKASKEYAKALKAFEEARQ